jgi:hypothetical protein
MERPGRRREVLNDARRRVERALGSADAADELASLVEGLLIKAESGQVQLDAETVDALQRTVARYRATNGR